MMSARRFSMKAVILSVLSTLILAAAPLSASAQTRFFLSGGLTGTSDYGFDGGWGGSLGLEHRLGEGGALLVRAEGSAVPVSISGSYLLDSELGRSGPQSKDATVLSLMAGLRLGGVGAIEPYLDALVGLGYVNDPANTAPAVPYPISTKRLPGDHANIALSLGPGLAVRTPFGPGVFADVHYDFYFVQGAGTPVIPVRLGLMMP
jgi:hypothetical protein